jgi:hypothetical protein
VLRDHGFSDTQIDQMAALGAIQMPDSTEAGTP